MPTQSTTYNSRVTDEALEKRFRDTFRAQGGAELVDDLYAQGVIVPIVDFTAAATGQQLSQNLQTAWDFSTGYSEIVNATNTTVISNAGFWEVSLTAALNQDAAVLTTVDINIFDGSSTKIVWGFKTGSNSVDREVVSQANFVIFLRSGDSLRGTADSANARLGIFYRQIATVSGDLVNPTGFTSS